MCKFGYSLLNKVEHKTSGCVFYRFKKNTNSPATHITQHVNRVQFIVRVYIFMWYCMHTGNCHFVFGVVVHNIT